jgi:catechol 2,3-dioxygenase-like lactoylglutathione lyase family enzyme
VIAWGLGMLPSTLLDVSDATGGGSASAEPGLGLQLGLAAVLGLVAGAILGAPQARVLRDHVARAWRWIPANAVAWAAGMPLVFLVAGGVPPGWPLPAVLGVVAATLLLVGAVVGAIHGWVLVRLLSSPDAHGHGERRPDLPAGHGARRGPVSSCGDGRAQGAVVAVELNHTIVAARDPERSAAFLAEILGLATPTSFGPFIVVETTNGVSLDFADAEEITPQHYAFLVSEAEFDEIFARIRAQDLPYWADPGRRRPGEINRNDGGRGVYFPDPDGHFLEIITRPYGSG